MDLELLYTLINAIVMPFWLLMVFAPGLPLTKRLLGALGPVALVPVIYDRVPVLDFRPGQAAALYPAAVFSQGTSSRRMMQRGTFCRLPALLSCRTIGSFPARPMLLKITT